jgi:hypothetical protein
MHYLAKAFLAVAANVLVTLIVFAVFRSMIHTPNEALIDYLVLLVGSTAHFWYITGNSWVGRISIAVISAILNVYGMFVVAIALGDGL